MYNIYIYIYACMCMYIYIYIYTCNTVCSGGRHRATGKKTTRIGWHYAQSNLHLPTKIIPTKVA